MWYSKILVAYDGSRPSEKAISIACEMAEANPSAHIVFAHVVRLMDGGIAGGDVNRALMNQAAELQKHLESVAAPFGERACVRMLKGTAPATLLVRCCNEEGCDVIVMGSRGMGGVKGYLGSVSRSVVQEAKACVVIAKTEGDAAVR